MYRKSDKGWLKHWDFILLDLLCLQIAYILAYEIRHGIHLPYNNLLYRNMTFIFVLIQIFVTFFGESFKNVLRRGYYKEFSMTFRHVCLVILLAALYLFATQTGEGYSRITLGLTGVLYLLIAYPARILWKKYLRMKGYDCKGKRSLLILTSEEMMDTVINNIRNNNYEGFQLAGLALYDEDKSRIGEKVTDVPIVADRNTVLDYVCREWVDEVFINLPKEIPLPEDMMNDFIEMGVTIHLKLIEVAKLRGQKRRVERMGNYTVLTSSINMASWKQMFYKRALDIAGGLVGCVITGMMFLVVAPCIYAKSPGPIFFSQTRIGKNGKKFKMYKFRSMYMDAEERKKGLMEQNRVKDGMMFKLEHDPRIIGGDNGIGGFIRKSSIDEFPQFWNVLKGDMSLVGTRPPTVDEWEKYELHHRVRLAIKPGLTGLWQVSGRSEIVDFEKVVELDKEYITEWSFGKDLRILMKTVGVVVGGRGSM